MTREEAIKAFRGLSGVLLPRKYYCEAIQMAISALQQPEIIRCKDCKHWDGVDTCDVIDAPVWDNDFCSLAERRSHE